MRGAGAATGARIPNMIAPSAGRTCKRGLSSPSGLASVMLLSTAGSFVLSRRGVGLTVMNGLPLEVLGPAPVQGVARVGITASVYELLGIGFGAMAAPATSWPSQWNAACADSS